MCGIVGVVAQREVSAILLEGLRRLEYRGYDSAGLAMISPNGGITRLRRLGKVAELASACKETPPSGKSGIAHTRWATHGEPSELNAHPHVSNGFAVVHNGIIENHEVLRRQLTDKGYHFESETDTEVIAHLYHKYLAEYTDELQAVLQLSPQTAKEHARRDKSGPRDQAGTAQPAHHNNLHGSLCNAPRHCEADWFDVRLPARRHRPRRPLPTG